MGDMADFANDDRMEEVINLHNHRDGGFPTDQQSYDDGFVDELGYETFTDRDFLLPRSMSIGEPYIGCESASRTCNRCGLPNLRWGNTKHGWRLFDQQDFIHNCVYDFKTIFPKNNPLDGSRMAEEELDQAFFWLLEQEETWRR